MAATRGSEDLCRPAEPPAGRRRTPASSLPRLICFRVCETTPSPHPTGQPVPPVLLWRRHGKYSGLHRNQRPGAGWKEGGGDRGTRCPELSPHAGSEVNSHSLANGWGWRGARAKRQDTLMQPDAGHPIYISFKRCPADSLITQAKNVFMRMRGQGSQPHGKTKEWNGNVIVSPALPQFPQL